MPITATILGQYIDRQTVKKKRLKMGKNNKKVHHSK